MNWTVVISSALSAIVTGVIAVLGSRAFYKPKLIAKMQNEGKKVLSERIMAALLDVQEMLEKLTTFNALWRGEDGNEAFDPKRRYLEAFTDKSYFLQFFGELTETIGRDGRFLDRESRAMVLALQEYFTRMVVPAAKWSEDEMRMMGWYIQPELYRFQKDFDRHLTSVINRVPYQLEIFEGQDWDDLLEGKIKQYVSDSAMVKLLDETYNATTPQA